MTGFESVGRPFRGMPAPDRAELLKRASEIALRLAERAPEADRLRRPADASIRELEASGLLASLTPEAHGGWEIALDTYCELLATLGEGCTSTAWVAGFYMVHAWIAAQFSEAARDEFFGAHPHFLAPGALSLTGTAAAVEGGYQVTGRWVWGTGIAHAEWVMVTAGVGDADGSPPPRMFVLPVADVRVEDTWFTDGMRGTASQDVIVEDAFVPAHRSLSYIELGLAQTPGARELSALYRLPMPPLLALTAALPAVGTGRAAVALFEQRLRERRMYMSATRQQEKPAAQMRLARAHVDVHAAWLLLRDLAARLTAHLEAGSPVTIEERAELRLAAARAVDLVRGAVRSLCEAAGASAHLETSPLQRMHRDIETLACHTIFDGDATAELAGRVMLGMDPGTPLV